MYGQLGNIRFQNLIGWNSFTRRTEASYADHELIEGKPRSQKIGDALDAIRFDIQLHHSFSDVQSDIETLRTACANGDVMPLTNGAGFFYGNFTIRTIDESHSQTFANGTPMLANLSLELVEYVDNTTAPATGFASNARRVTSARGFNGSGKILMRSAVQTTANANTAGSHITSSKKGIAGSIKKAQRALKKVREGLTKTQQSLDQAKMIITAKDRIANDISRTQQAVQNAADALAQGDIDGAIQANRELQNGVAAMNGGLSEVAVVTATRRDE